MVRLGQVPYPSSLVPADSEVRFDHHLQKKREYFYLSVTAGAYHSEALVIGFDDSVRQVPLHYAQEALTD